jgi:hypothetical protein
VINEVCPANGDIVHDLQYFNFSGWVEIFNKGTASLNIGGYYLSDNSGETKKWRIPTGTTIGAKQHLLIWCDGKNALLHTNFELDSEGEEIVLSNSGGTQIDKIVFPQQFTNVSYGRTQDGGSSIGYLVKPTPGQINVADTGTKQLETPDIPLKAGRYTGTQSVSVTHPDTETVIRFTTNGSEPTESSAIFSAAFSVSKTSTVKAKAFKKGFLPSKTKVKTFFINEHTFGLPVISISLNESYLTDNTIGIYTVGTNGIAGYCQNTPANWNQDWDRHAVLEFFDQSGNKDFDESVDLRIGGNCSRAFPLKSFAIKARDKYGDNTIDRKLFAEKESSSYGGFMLRNAGNDFWQSMFRDALMQRIVKDQMDVDYQAYEPKAIYLNGKYWGILNLREKIDADYFKTNYGVDKDDLDLGEWEMALEGSVADYNSYVNTLASMDPGSPETYAYIDSNIDVQEFINYLVTEIYYCNTDWPGNNVKYWRKTGGKWRWVLWDLDFGMGLYTERSYPTHPTLHFATEANGPQWPNPPWSTRHLRLLLQNPTFREKFIATFTSSLSTTFKPGRVISFIDAFEEKIQPEMPHHVTRWGNWLPNWNYEVQRLRDFATQRNVFMHDYLKNFFGLSDNVRINLTTTPEQGKVILNGIASSEDIQEANYFRGIRYNIAAEALPGYRFSHWNITEQQSTQISLIGTGASWKYSDGGTEPSADWQALSFDDALWSEGNAQLGYGEGDEQTITSYGSDPNNKHITTYFRKTILVADTAGLTSLSGSVLFDDGVAIYFNGDEVYRANLPGGTITNTMLATVASAENVYQSFTIPKGAIKPGNNTIAVEVHQNSAASSDISFDLSLSTVKVGETVGYTSDQAVVTGVANTDIYMHAFFVPVQSINGLVINEFSAHESDHLDEKAEAEDWIEIYNNSEETIDLAGLFISDNLSQDQKYQIKATDGTTIGPGEYKILYADEELFDGPLHVNFKLSADGESIGLYQKVGNDLQTLDQLSYDAQIHGSSYSRIPNLTGPFIMTSARTPLAPNVYELVVGVENENIVEISLYPNPAMSQITVQCGDRMLGVNVKSITGQAVMMAEPESNSITLDVAILPAGLYLMEVITPRSRVVKKFVVMD